MNVGIIVASGEGKRMGNKDGKQFINLGTKPMLSYSLAAFQEAKSIEKIVVVVKEENIEKAKILAQENNIDKLFEVTAGGKKRQDSVFLGLTACPPEMSIAVIHDGARPFVKPTIIDKAVSELDCDGLVTAIPVKDTIKRRSDSYVAETYNRKELIAAQTPQVFVSKSLIEAHNIARSFDFYASDDAAIMEKQKYKIKVIDGDEDNIKITTPIDLELAEIILNRRQS